VSAPTKSKEIKALTGLRGIAACFVALYHFGHHITEPHVHWAIHKGYLSVDVFFVLSGFVMALTYERIFAEGITANKWGRFLWLRVARIWPLYVCAVVAGLFAITAAGETVSGSTTIANIFMVQGWGIANSINPPLWSVSVEFVAYLIFPVLLALITGTRGAGTALAGLAAATIIAWAVFLGAHNGTGRMGALDLFDPHTALPAMRCVAGFTLGIAVWHLSRMRRVAEIFNRGIAGLVCAGSILILFAVNANDLLIYAFFPLLILSISHDKGALATTLGTSFIRWLGVLSYSIYALQSPYYDLAEPIISRLTGHTFLYYPAVAAGLLIVSASAHYGIERPSRLALRSLTRSKSVPVAA
jgi:peptidoglycan/LPS O-acetylase OafA/YrhL